MAAGWEYFCHSKHHGGQGLGLLESCSVCHGGTDQAPHACGKAYLTVTTRTSYQVQKNRIGLQSLFGEFCGLAEQREGDAREYPRGEKQALGVSRFIAQQRAGHLP